MISIKTDNLKLKENYASIRDIHYVNKELDFSGKRAK